MALCGHPEPREGLNGTIKFAEQAKTVSGEETGRMGGGREGKG